jgi:hypothetical protein
LIDGNFRFRDFRDDGVLLVLGYVRGHSSYPSYKYSYFFFSFSLFTSSVLQTSEKPELLIVIFTLLLFEMANLSNSPAPRLPQVPNRVEVILALRPLENRQEAVVLEVHEEVLQWNYDISSSVRLFFQNPTTRSIDGGDITLFQRIFMAGLRLPFLEIARDFVLFLMVAPSQIMPNAWKYLFASLILWKIVLRLEMNIGQFFNIYSPR